MQRSWGVGVLLQEPHQEMSRRFDVALDVVIPQRVCRRKDQRSPLSPPANTPSSNNTWKCRCETIRFQCQVIYSL